MLSAGICGLVVRESVWSCYKCRLRSCTWQRIRWKFLAHETFCFCLQQFFCIILPALRLRLLCPVIFSVKPGLGERIPKSSTFPICIFCNIIFINWCVKVFRRVFLFGSVYCVHRNCRGLKYIHHMWKLTKEKSPEVTCVTWICKSYCQQCHLLLSHVFLHVVKHDIPYRRSERLIGYRTARSKWFNLASKLFFIYLFFFK